MGGNTLAGVSKMIGYWFQALFCWIDGGERDEREGAQQFDRQFQALFCWIDGGELGTGFEGGLLLRGFKPCFVG